MEDSSVSQCLKHALTAGIAESATIPLQPVTCHALDVAVVEDGIRSARVQSLQRVARTPELSDERTLQFSYRRRGIL